MTLEAGQRIKYRSQTGQTREGTIKKVGRKWIEFQSENGQPANWCTLESVLKQTENSHSTNGTFHSDDSVEPAVSREETMVDNGSIPMKLAPGTRCRYHKWNA